MKVIRTLIFLVCIIGFANMNMYSQAKKATSKKKTTVVQKKTAPVGVKSKTIEAAVEKEEVSSEPLNPLVAASEKASTQGKGEIFKSIDNGKNWKSVYQDFKVAVRSVAYGNAKWVAVADDKVLTSTSGDEDSWEITDIKVVCYSTPRSIAAGGGAYVIVGDKGMVMYSKDSKKWIVINNIGGLDLGTLNFTNVKFINDKFYVIGNMNLIVSMGLTADKFTVENVSRNSESPSDFLSCLFYSGKIYACRKAFFRSSDGKMFNQFTVSPPITIQAAAGGNGIFVGANIAGGAFSSPDALVWKKSESLGSGANAPMFYDMIFANNTFIAVGDKGAIWTSKNGVDWKKRSTDKLIPNKFLSIASSN